jgi:hypothetical protein
VVLNCFAGSGTTLIAAEKCGRLARLVEFDPVYCDRILTRFETFTGKQARLEAGVQHFEDVGDPNVTCARPCGGGAGMSEAPA